MFLGKILELLLSARIFSPCGAFTYASGACGGHISDPQIVGSSGWFGLVGGFDVILADKGFLIKGQISTELRIVRNFKTLTKVNEQLRIVPQAQLESGGMPLPTAHLNHAEARRCVEIPKIDIAEDQVRKST